MADKKFQHALISFSYTYEGEDKIPSREVSRYLAQALPDNHGRQLERITTYSTGYHMMPTQCGLRDVWNNMLDEEHEQFAEQYPELATAIALMCGGNDEGKSGATSNSSSRRDDETQSGSIGLDVAVEPGTGETTS